MKVKYISRCACGAITLIFENGASNSMYEETFEKIKHKLDLSEASELSKTYMCDHCVNHWGIDLCECGSGERVGECECESCNAHDKLGVKFDSFDNLIKKFS